LLILVPTSRLSFTIDDTDQLLQPHDERNPGLKLLDTDTLTAAQEVGRIAVAAELQPASAR
jgi:hypothetical protein